MKNNKEKGMSILEAIVASVIVGIGFIGIFQMVGYAVNSIDVSGERSKAGHLVGMIAEGVLGYKDTYVGVSENDEQALIFEDGKAFLPSELDRKACAKFVQFYTNLDFEETDDTNACGSDTKLNNINTIINTDRCSTEDKLPLYKKNEASVWGGKSAASNQILKCRILDLVIRRVVAIRVFICFRDWASQNPSFQSIKLEITITPVVAMAKINADDPPSYIQTKGVITPG